MNRRRLLQGLVAGATLVGARPRARAAVGPEGRKLVTVVAAGGWDVTRVFAPAFGADAVAMEADAARADAGGVEWVSHPDRPSVDAFFETYHARLAVLNGLSVPSVNHESCHSLLFTGVIGGRRPDWATWIAQAQRDAFALPHLVMGSVGFSGDLAEIVCNLGRKGQLDRLLSGALLDEADLPVSRLTPEAAARVDGFAREVARARAEAAGGAARPLLDDLAGSLDRAALLEAHSASVSFTFGEAVDEQIAVLVDTLAAGLSRCVTLQVPVDDLRGWDHHTQNDRLQSAAFEALFAALATLLAALDATPGPAGGSLADETLVCVVSEMGRTPWLSQTGGKDHWPFTSAMLIGPGVAGDRVVGGFDDQLYGRGLDPGSSAIDDDADPPTPAELGATLLTLCGVDPGSATDAAPLPGLLAD